MNDRTAFDGNLYSESFELQWEQKSRPPDGTQVKRVSEGNGLLLESIGVTMASSCEPIEQILNGGTVMKERDDNSLLEAIADRRDDAAFSELCERYQKRAFNVAFLILKDSALAEDAVQEAMLSIWEQSSKDVQPKVDPTSWILRIVANKSHYLRRSQRHKAKREGHVSIEQSRPQIAVSEEVEGHELIALLRSHIDQLPDLERTLLTYSYVSSMAHREIAKQVCIPHRTVTFKIQQCLEYLRKNLAKAGVTAVAPLLSSGSLYEALTTGQDCPPGMMERIKQRIKSCDNPSRALSRRAASVRHAGWTLPASAAIVLAAGLGGAWWIAQNQGKAVSPVQPAEKEPSANADVQPAIKSESKPISARWTFKKGPVEALTVLRGPWQWQNGQMVAPESGALVSLPIELPAHPVVCNVKASSIVGILYHCRAYWKNGTVFAPTRDWIKFQTMKMQPYRHFSIYFIDRFSVVMLNGFTVEIREARTPYPSRDVALSFAGIKVDEIEVHSLQAGEIPEFLRDIPQVIKELGGDPRECDEHGVVTKTSDR